MAFSNMNLKMCGVILLGVGLAACEMDNPAFGDDELGGSGDTSASESGESGSSSGSDTTDATTTDTTTGDTTTGDTTAGDTTPGDSTDTSTSDSTDGSDTGGVEMCMGEFGDPFVPIYGETGAFNGQCPPVVTSQYLRLTGVGLETGLVMGQRCMVAGCDSCSGTSIPVGVVGLDDFSGPLGELLEQGLSPCIKVQTGPILGIDGATRCTYSSIWIGAGNPIVDVLLASHDPAALPAAGSTLLGDNGIPEVGDTVTHCPCESLFGPGSEDLGCCLDSMTEPAVASLAFAGADVLPVGMAQVGFANGLWNFHVAQSQVRPSCDNPEGSAETSWALVRGN